MNRIRLARVDDAGAVAQSSAGLGYGDRDPAKVARDLADLLSSKYNKVWVYDLEGSIAGWVHAFLSIRLASERFVEIGGLAVHPNFQRRGIGAALVTQALEWAKSEEVKIRVRCSSVREDTHEFYRALGFARLKSQLVFEQKF